MSDKYNEIESQILYQISQLHKTQKNIKIQHEKGELSTKDYDILFNQCIGGLNHLYIALTCFDNPLSNYKAKLNPESSNNKSKKKAK